MTKRAKNLIEQTYGNKIQPAIAALVEFAAQNAGLEPRNYYNPWEKHVGRIQAFNDGLRAYRQEARSINQDWQRFKSALAIAAIEGVTDADVIAEAPHAFSGRLEPVATCSLWSNKTVCNVVGVETEPYAGYRLTNRERKDNWYSIQPATLLAIGWEYTTGQYFPTEYRKAAATLIEYATRRVRQNRPKDRQIVTTIAELKALNERNGGCWFAPAEMRFFGTRIESEIIKGKYFISSEQPPHGSRKYSVRTFNDEGRVETVGEFCAYHSKAEAKVAIPTAEEVAT